MINILEYLKKNKNNTNDSTEKNEWNCWINYTITSISYYKIKNKKYDRKLDISCIIELINSINYYKNSFMESIVNNNNENLVKNEFFIFDTTVESLKLRIKIMNNILNYCSIILESYKNE